MGISKESPYLKENLWNQAKWLDLLCWCPPSASNSIILSSKNVTPKMLQKAYAPVDYVWFTSVAFILCARACRMLSRKETNKGLGDHTYEKNSFSTIHLLHLYNNTSHYLQCSCCEQVHEWLRNTSQVSMEKLRSISSGSEQKSHQKDGHLEGAWQFPASLAHKQGSVNAGS